MSTNIVRTGKFATEEQRKRIVELAEIARKTPVIAFSSEHALKEGGLSGQAWKSVHEAIYKAALSVGLPEIEGYYGMDGSNGEFITT